MCAHNGIYTCKTKVVQPFAFKDSIVRKVVRKVKCKQKGHKAECNKNQEKSIWRADDVQSAVRHNGQGKV